MSNFTVADFVSRVNVASRSRLKSVLVLHTRLSFNILDVLYRNGIIRSFKIVKNGILVFLKYYQNKSIFHLKLISRPGKKVYWTLGKLSLRYNANVFGGFYLISTSFGLLTSNDCLLGRRISGEILLKVEI